MNGVGLKPSCWVSRVCPPTVRRATLRVHDVAVECLWETLLSFSWCRLIIVILIGDGLLPGEKLHRVGSIAQQHLTRGYHRKPANRGLIYITTLIPISNVLSHSDHILEVRTSLLLSLSPSYSNLPPQHQPKTQRAKITKSQTSKIA